MKIKFSIHYQTAWGQQMHVVVKYFSRTDRVRVYNLPMQTDDGDLWTLETAVMESRQLPVSELEYFYQLEDADGRLLRREWNKISRRYAYDASMTFSFDDAWRDVPIQYHLYTEACNVTIRRKRHDELKLQRMPLFRKTILFRVAAPQLAEGECIGILGSHPSLGDWNPARYLSMVYMGDAEWMLTVDAHALRQAVEYKYVVVDKNTHQLKQWEEGDNRVVDCSTHDEGVVMVKNGGVLRTCELQWKAAGVMVPLFSLRSESSFGVGDLGDLSLLTDWAAATGLKIIQLLPLLDTTHAHDWTDSHPYNVISAFAIHPQYLDLNQLGTLRDEKKMTAYARKRRELNALGYADYMAVQKVKSAYFDDWFEENANQVAADADFTDFVRKNEAWLTPYAAFAIARDEYHTAKYTEWPELQQYDPEKVTTWLEARSDECRKVMYMQYQLHCQLLKACVEARKMGVALKGDMPVGMFRDSVETWRYPQLFDLDMQMGTPPNEQGLYGQNWGFPAYRWENDTTPPQHAETMTLTEWMKWRLRVMEQYFDAVRIDNMTGYFHSWIIPNHSIQPTMGYYTPSLPFSEDELGTFGLTFRKNLLTKPFINDAILKKLFGIHVQYVKDTFLVQKAYGLYALREEVFTQRDVMHAFIGKTDENSLWIRDGLMNLIGNVLFIEDMRQPGMYHPRYQAYKQPVFDMLDAEEKDAMMRLYNNYYNERHRDYWGEKGRRKLEDIFSETRMMVCAEDLGTMTENMREVVERQRILSLEIQSMPKSYGSEFCHLEAYPYLSVCSFSTHDMPTMRLWWEENAGRTQRYYASMMQKQGKAPKEMPAHLCEEVIARHMYSPAMICMMAMQDWMAMDADLRTKKADNERVNAPYDPYNQWKYRIHVTLEQMLRCSKWNAKICTMVTRSKR